MMIPGLNSLKSNNEIRYIHPINTICHAKLLCMATGKDYVMGLLNDLEKLGGNLEKLSTSKRLDILEQQVRDIIKVIEQIANYINDKENK